MQIYKALYVFCFLIILIIPVRAQNAYTEISEGEDQLKTLFDSIFYRNEIRFLRTDDEKIGLNDTLLSVFRELLTKKESFDYPFDKLINCGILKSSDNRVKIYNWNLRFGDGSHKYYGFIQYYHPKKNEVYTWELTDASDSMPDPENRMLTEKQWFGALYYYILAYNEGKKTNYILLGWDGNNHFTNKKIVESLYFTNEGEPRFGKAIFKKDNDVFKRFIIEYPIRVTVALVYDEKVGAIVWDHLAPDNNSKKDDINYYGPDGSYDGFKQNGNKWIYIPEIFVTNPKVEK